MKATSLIFDLRNGFLMYHVEVRKVKTKTKSSVLPAISHFSGVYLQNKNIIFWQCIEQRMAYCNENNMKSATSSMMYSGRIRNAIGTSFGNGNLSNHVSSIKASIMSR